MTLKQIEALSKEMLTPSDVAAYLECDPQLIRIQAHQDKSKLGFPVIIAGSRVKIPKEGFIRYMRYGATTLALHLIKAKCRIEREVEPTTEKEPAQRNL